MFGNDESAAANSQTMFGNGSDQPPEPTRLPQTPKHCLGIPRLIPPPPRQPPLCEPHTPTVRTRMSSGLPCQTWAANAWIVGSVTQKASGPSYRSTGACQSLLNVVSSAATTLVAEVLFPFIRRDRLAYVDQPSCADYLTIVLATSCI